MLHPHDAPSETPSERRRGAVAGFAVGIALALAAAGCLPSATRGDASGPAGSAVATAAARTPSPAPSGPTVPATIVPPTPTPAPTFLVYVVKRGDSLTSIAHRFGTTARSIAFWNRATYPSLDPESAKYRPDLLKLGWTLFLVPNDVVDEQDLPGPSTDPAESLDPAATDPADTPAEEPSATTP